MPEPRVVDDDAVGVEIRTGHPIDGPATLAPYELEMHLSTRDLGGDAQAPGDGPLVGLQRVGEPVRLGRLAGDATPRPEGSWPAGRARSTRSRCPSRHARRSGGAGLRWRSRWGSTTAPGTGSAVCGRACAAQHRLSEEGVGGEKRIRTAGLCRARAALYQLSYLPVRTRAIVPVGPHSGTPGCRRGWDRTARAAEWPVSLTWWNRNSHDGAVAGLAGLEARCDR